MRKLMQIIPAIAIIVLTSACASNPVDPFSPETLGGSDVEQPAPVDPALNAARARSWYEALARELARELCKLENDNC